MSQPMTDLELIPTLTELFNLPSELEWRGKVYQLPKATPVQTARYSKWLEDKAMNAITRNNALEAADRRELMQVVLAEVVAGRYDWGSLLCFQSLASPLGQAKLVEILLEGQLSELEAREMSEELHDVIALKIMRTIESDPVKKKAFQRLLSLGESSAGSSRNHRSTKRRKK